MLTKTRKLIAIVAAVAVFGTLLSAGSAGASTGAVKRTAPIARTSSWGFHALLWRYTIADPWGAHRIYYYNKCNPKPGKRYLRMYSGWIYRTYECWAILA